jgi:hypothetical protein
VGIRKNQCIGKCGSTRIPPTLRRLAVLPRRTRDNLFGQALLSGNFLESGFQFSFAILRSPAKVFDCWQKFAAVPSGTGNLF